MKIHQSTTETWTRFDLPCWRLDSSRDTSQWTCDKALELMNGQGLSSKFKSLMPIFQLWSIHFSRSCIHSLDHIEIFHWCLNFHNHLSMDLTFFCLISTRWRAALDWWNRHKFHVFTLITSIEFIAFFSCVYFSHQWSFHCRQVFIIIHFFALLSINLD